MSVETDLLSGKTQDKVENLLQKYPELRDNDKTLFLTYLNLYHGLRDKLRSAHDPYEVFKEIILSEDVPMFESVSRARRKLQEMRAHLRGQSYDVKKGSAEQISLWAVKG